MGTYPIEKKHKYMYCTSRMIVWRVVGEAAKERASSLKELRTGCLHLS